MSEDWNTKYGPRRVRRDPPTLDEAIFAAVGITDDQEAQAEIAASLMGLPLEAVQAEVRKAGRTAARASTTRVIAGEQGAQRSVVVERRVVRKFGNDKRTGHLTRRASSARTEIRCLAAASGSGRAPPAVHSQQQLPIGAVETGGRAHGFDPRSRAEICAVRAGSSVSGRCCRWIRRAGRSDARRTWWRAPASPHSRPGGDA